MAVPDDTRSEEWHEARLKGIGGSEWGDVLGLEPYGCARKLWYEKRRFEPDFPPEGVGFMRRGQKLEQLVVEEVEALYPFKLRTVRRLKAQDLPDWWIGNLDRQVVAGTAEGQRGPGVFEAKTKGPWPYMHLRKNGISDAEKLQVQHYIGLSGWEWGLYACLEPVSWRLLVQFIDRDEEALRLMTDIGNDFWRDVTEGQAPHRLMPSDKRCRTCAFRWTCHGEELMNIDESPEGAEEWDDPYLLGLITQRDEIMGYIKDLKDLQNQNSEQIKAHLGEPRKVIINSRPVVWKKTTRFKIDDRALKSDEPEIYKKYLRTRPFEYFRVY